ncbi:LacI family DNA-binding transcriptional regulator [Mangrovivirga cuniculi]|uniref:HTH lacI-type domain-containing protein n=1 Tax=Mangrovivirga cuniculi TaxID=2715131 RepID=A0A4D7JC54_9BACT|nr:LacI family DNA-binding transcriptional regulator [Mangrovivirga cuniculi]QCK13281.1 hypothetical protein DCC35_00205 [Mangrovivirga cuniculi]
MKKKVTIKDIAKEAGVSIGTVDRVLHNRGDVAAKTKEKILKIAEKHDYSTNIFARNLKLSKEYLICTVLPGGNQYWELQHFGFKRASEEFKNQGIRLKSFEYNAKEVNGYLKSLKDAIDSKPSAIALVPVAHPSTYELLEKIEKAGIPYVFVDTQLPEASPLSFIGQDSFMSGQLAAKLLCYGRSEKVQNIYILYQNSNLHNKAITDRIEGFESFIEENAKDKNTINKVNLDTEEDFERVYKEMTEHEEVHIFIPNSKAFQFAEFINKKNDVKYRLLGYDLTEKNAANIYSGSIDFIINPKPQLQGFLSIQTLHKHLILNQKVAKKQFMPLDIVTKENLTYYGQEHV